MNQILVVEDEDIIRTSLRRLLEKNRYSVIEASSVQEALTQTLSDFDLIITDLRLPGKPGTELISLAAGTPVLVMTSFASLKSAVDAMKMGAVDYIAKPFDHDELLASVKKVLKKQTDRSTPAPATETPTASDTLLGYAGYAGIIGQSTLMQNVFRKISKVAPTDATVLIRGESGTGKELVAKALHTGSPRSSGPLISVNCAAIPETLIESELFGHEKGAFTGANNSRKGLVEAANGGTLFLDEIGELPLEAQARLLRLLQEKEVRKVGSIESIQIDVRLVAATHRDLKKLAAAGQFREDLYYRLHVVELKLPPLRDRGADILDLAHFFMKSLCEKRCNIETASFSKDALELIQAYAWPGNVRELENAIERALILCEENIITRETLDIEPDNSSPTPATPQPTAEHAHTPPLSTETKKSQPTATSHSDELSLEDYFQRFVLENQDQMTETQLAQKLGISRKCLWERRQRLGIPRKKR